MMKQSSRDKQKTPDGYRENWREMFKKAFWDEMREKVTKMQNF